jgi:succinyl-CoA synthetase beta subunit
MLGYNLITHQTTKEGLKVNAVLVHEGVDIVKEHYLAFVLDRNSQKPAVICSKFGGVEIEEVDKKDIHVFTIEPK